MYFLQLDSCLMELGQAVSAARAAQGQPVQAALGALRMRGLSWCGHANKGMSLTSQHCTLFMAHISTDAVAVPSARSVTIAGVRSFHLVAEFHLTLSMTRKASSNVSRAGSQENLATWLGALLPVATVS
jgi:hypothetical protein